MNMIPAALLLSTLLQFTSTHPVLEEMRRQFVNPHEVNNLTIADSRIRDVYHLKSSVNNLTETIGKIEDAMKLNPSLPRLTRGELLDLMENITRSKNIPDKRDRKSVMIVMPFTPDKAEQVKIEDLYTKPPLTTFIGEVGKNKENVVKRIIKRRRRPFDKTTAEYAQTTSKQTSTRKPNYVNNFKRVRISNRISSVAKETPLPTTTDSEVITFKSFVEEFTTASPVQHFPVYQPTTSTEVSIVSKSSQAHYNIVKRRRRPTVGPVQETTKQQYPEGPKPIITNQVLKLLHSPNLNQEVVQTTTARPLRTRSTTQPPKIETTTFYQRYPFPVSSAKPFELPPSTLQQQSATNNFFLPENLKYTLDELNINKIPNTYNSINYVEQQQVPEDVKNILDSFVVYSPTTNSPDIKNVAESLSPDMKELLMSFGLLPNPQQTEPLVEEQQEEQLASASAPVINPNSYTQFKPLPDSVPLMDDMQEFLDRFGLGRRGKSAREPKAFSLEKQDTNLDDMPFIEVGMIPESLRGIIDDLGIIERNSSERQNNSDESTRNSKKIRSELIEKVLEKPNEEVKYEKHIFKPTDVPYAVEELNKLSQLLDIIKQLEKLNKTVTEEDFSQDELKNLTELVGSLNNDKATSINSYEEVKNLTEIISNLNAKNRPLNEQSWGPDPLNFDLGLEKNEVKRQENSTSTKGENLDIVTPSTVTTTDESKNIKGLEESFGGAIGASDTDLATLPPPSSTPNTGFYYLLDWNSFLEVDDQKGKRVNLRLQPKVGDPKKFYSVSVP